jgi:hypothetical protein
MENPNSWTKDTHAIHDAIVAHRESVEAGAIGGSLAMYIEQTVLRPIHESYKKQILSLTQEIRDAVRSAQDEATWKATQGEDYGSY